MSGRPKPNEFLTLNHLLLTLFPGSRNKQIWGNLSLNKKNFIAVDSSRVSLYCHINEDYNNSIVIVDGLTYQLSYQREQLQSRENPAYYCFKLDPI